MTFPRFPSSTFWPCFLLDDSDYLWILSPWIVSDHTATKIHILSSAFPLSLSLCHAFPQFSLVEMKRLILSQCAHCPVIRHQMALNRAGRAGDSSVSIKCRYPLIIIMGTFICKSDRGTHGKAVCQRRWDEMIRPGSQFSMPLPEKIKLVPLGQRKPSRSWTGGADQFYPEASSLKCV